MEWATIRAAYKEARKARGLNQDQVAGMKQGMVSKLETNENLGPAVETFVKAVEGLGIPVSSFFKQIEGLPSIAVISANAAGDPDEGNALRFDTEERIAERVLRSLARLALKEGPPKRPANRRVPPDARPHAAERRAAPRKARRRHVPPATKRRPPKPK